MAVTANERGTVLGIINEVERKMGYNTSSTLSASRTSQLFLDFLNDTVNEVADFGDWPQLYEEVTISANACAREIEINTSAPIQRVYEIHEGSQITPMYRREIEDIRLLDRTSAKGTPRQYALIKTSGINPILRIYPRTNTSTQFNAGVYNRPLVFVSGDESIVPPFSSRLLAQGVFTRAVLDEGGHNVQNTQYQANYTLFRNQLSQEHDRNTSDVSTDIYLTVR